MRYMLLANLLVLAASSCGFAQPLVAEFPIGGGLITIRNPSESLVAASGMDFSSPNGSLIPAPGGFNDIVPEVDQNIHGDLSGNPDPFLFMLRNTPNQVTYGSLGQPGTFPPGSCTVLSAGVEANADVVFFWGGGGTPVAGPVEFVEVSCVSEPTASNGFGFGIGAVLLYRGRRRTKF